MTHLKVLDIISTPKIVTFSGRYETFIIWRGTEIENGGV